MFQLGFYAITQKIIEKMKSFGNFGAFCLLILVAGLSAGVEARRLALRPLSVRELRAALRETGLDEDSEAGRSLSSAVAGITGFALGITKGVGGSLLFDVITSNATIQYVTNLLNTTSSSTTGSTGTAQEICFKSRSADGETISGRSSNNRDSSDDLVYSDPISSELPGEERQLGTGTGTGTGSSGGGVTCIVLNSGVRRRRQLVARPDTTANTRNRSRSRRQSKRRVDQRVR
ncbi:uncharacterized protein LOC108158323 [Drosophila miranda]|uniref:uncharacterized protein LOC108158323 n=1 Tax=Drosophila miranda TaxID=7229 RepID=UPI0007E6AAC9|nr:uncharacterized protein LOC108158323 [Drosophila miranda]